MTLSLSPPHKRSATLRKLVASLVSVAALGFASRVHAYRPFDGTDADVADVGVFELELGPAQFYRRASNKYLIAPATVLNLGVIPNLELVVGFNQVIANRPVVGESRVAFRDTDVLLKWLMRAGSMQGAHGISVALEVGPRLPEYHGDQGLGAQANFILSYRAWPGTLHLNEEVALSRSRELEVFSSVIVEGPDTLTVRPVAEIFVERELNAEQTTYSALLGAIWSAAGSLSVDAALRLAREEGAHSLEVRFGFTWAEALWSRPAAAPQNAKLSFR